MLRAVARRTHTLPPLLSHTLVSSLVWKKRQRKAAAASEEKEEETESSTDRPVWVVCPYTFDMWKRGLELPAHMQLSPEAAAQVMRIKYFAKAQAEQPEMVGSIPSVAELVAEEEEEEEHTPLPCAGPMSSWVTPDVEALKQSLVRLGGFSVPRPDSATRA